MVMHGPLDLAPSQRLRQLMVNDEGFVFDPVTGESYQLTPTALVCLRCLQRGGTPEDLVAQIMAQWDVEELRVRSDLDGFLGQLKELHWR